MNFKNEIKNLFLQEGFSEIKVLKDNQQDKSIVIGAFPYYVETESTINGVKISPFAQKDHYGEAVNRLKKVSLIVREKKSLNKRDIRIFCNSRLEEKWYAANSGLGFYGRNSLIITEKAGSRVILAGMIIPIDLDADEKSESSCIPGGRCGSCYTCITNCPTSAIESNGYINRDKCLQSLTTDDRILPENILENWGNRLYGCSICQDCCPFNKNPQSRAPRDLCSEGNTDIKGFLGQSLSFNYLLQSDDSTLKKFFRGTALSMSWIKYDLLRRNTIISSVYEKRVDLIPLLETYLDHPDLSYAAHWAIKRLNQSFTTLK